MRTINAPATYPDQMLLPVSIHAFFPPAELAVDVYLHPVPERRRFLYTAAEHGPLVTDLEKLIAQGTRTLFVRRDQIREFNQGLEKLLASDVEIGSFARFEIAKEVAKANFAEAWCRPATDALVQMAAQLADRVIVSCRSCDGLGAQLTSLLAHDGSTFSHVTNVCVYGVLLAMNMGISDPKVLSEIAVAGLLHDLGKRSILPDLLRKQGALSPQERKAIELHPTKGFEELCHRDDMSQGQLSMVYQHHERIDGSGYPVGAVGSEIHWMAKLCSIIDVFDALTGHRPYRKPARAEEALEFLTMKSGTQFDTEMVKCWSSVVTEATTMSA